MREHRVIDLNENSFKVLMQTEFILFLTVFASAKLFIVWRFFYALDKQN